MSVAQREQGLNRTAPNSDRQHINTEAEASGLLQDLQDDLQTASHQLEIQAARGIENGGADANSWVERVNRLQADIEQSKVTARAIVQQAEAHNQLTVSVADCSQRIQLLEKELQFSEALEAALVEIQSFYRRLDKVRELLVSEKTVSASAALKQVNKELEASNSLSSNVIHALESRSTSLADELVSAARSHLFKCFRITNAPPSVDASLKDVKKGEASLAETVAILHDFDRLSEPLRTIKDDLQAAFFRPLSDKSSDTQVRTLQRSADKLWIVNERAESSVTSLLGQISLIVRFISDTLPKTASQMLSAAIMPEFLKEFEANKLTPQIPLRTGDLTQLDHLLPALQQVTESLKEASWHGASELDSWVSKLPTLWLTRQREHVLEIMRQSLLQRLRERKKVERVETQTVDPEDLSKTVDNEDAAWDTEWTEEKGRTANANDGDDDASAWETGDEDMNDGNEEASNAKDSAGDTAWGWDDDSGNVSSPVQHQRERTQPRDGQTQKLTLREQYTVTGVPGAVLEQCLEIFRDARRMGESSATDSPIGAGIPALWNLPALSMALYRAMAVTSYEKIDLGKILLYNDSYWLADQIHSLAGGAYEYAQDIKFTGTIRRKLEQEASAFDRFAKLAYGAEMESQRTILKDLLDGAQGFSNCTTSPFAEECDNAISMTLDRLRYIYHQWQPLLSRSALLQSLGSLLGTVISKFTSDIEDLADIGEDESARLLSFCKSISSINDLFSEQNGEETRDMTPLYCQKWLKLQYLAEILDGNLADIKYLWNEGELSIEFDADEITDLIRALFADSEHRRKAIAEIGRSNRRPQKAAFVHTADSPFALHEQASTFPIGETDCPGRMQPGQRAGGVQNGHREKLANSYQELLDEYNSKDLRSVGNYTVGRLIGKGSFGKVYLASHKLTNGSKVVLKSTKRDDQNLPREIHHHRQFIHPHIARLYEVIVTETLVWLVLEWCPGNELYHHLLQHGRMESAQVQRIFTQLVGAVSYVHNKGCVHRDLKLENILLDKHGNVKLVDFGFTREYSGSTSYLQTWCGTVAYSAPEMIKGEKYAGEKVDVWSLGIILFALLKGELPYDDDDDLLTKQKILKEEPQFPDYFPDGAKDLIQKLLSKRPLLRPCLADILRHPWLSDHAPQQQEILKLQQPAPFSTQLEKDTLARMRSAGVNIDHVIENVLAQRCDGLAGWWALLIEKEERKIKRRERKRKEKEREEKALRRLSAASGRLLTAPGLKGINEESQTRTSARDASRSRGRRISRSSTGASLVRDLPQVDERTAPSPEPIRQSMEETARSASPRPESPPKETVIRPSASSRRSSSMMRLNPQSTSTTNVLQKRKKLHHSAFRDQLANIKAWFRDSTRRAKSPTSSRKGETTSPELHGDTAKHMRRSSTAQLAELRKAQRPARPEVATRVTLPARTRLSTTSSHGSSNSMTGMTNAQTQRISLSPQPMTPQSSSYRRRSGLGRRKSTSSSVSSARSFHVSHPSGISHSKASSTSSANASLASPSLSNGPAPRASHSPHPSIKVLAAPTTIPAGLRVQRRGAPTPLGLTPGYGDIDGMGAPTSPGMHAVFARQKRKVFKGPSLSNTSAPRRNMTPGGSAGSSGSRSREQSRKRQSVEIMTTAPPIAEEEEDESHQFGLGSYASGFETGIDEGDIEEVDAFSPVLGEETGGDGEEGYFRNAHPAEIHVVVSNGDTDKEPDAL